MSETPRLDVTEQEAEAVLKKPYQWIFMPESDGGYSCFIREFPGCCSQGDTIEEARDNLRDAATGWLMASADAGHVIAQPLIATQDKGWL